jgi:uncharacterized protein DUF1259
MYIRRGSGTGKGSHLLAALRVVGCILFVNTTLARVATAQATATPADGGSAWAAVQRVLGGKGTMQPGDVLKFGFPRSDLHVTAGGVAIKPALALGSWVAFRRTGSAASSPAMAMGDLVLTEDEVAPVMQALQQGGVEQTALHNHLLHESPHLMYMHIMAHGDPVKIATTIRTALGASATPMPQAATGGAASPPASARLDLDTAGIARALRASGKVNGGVYQVSVPRAGRITDHGMEVPPSMGVATGINFQPTGGGKAAITGDFVMIASEVNPVIRALRQHGIEVTALHSHMLTESPRLFFMHFWANDNAVNLASGLGAALDAMAVKRASAR